jgi:hypothetical protein
MRTSAFKSNSPGERHLIRGGAATSGHVNRTSGRIARIARIGRITVRFETRAIRTIREMRPDGKADEG